MSAEPMLRVENLSAGYEPACRSCAAPASRSRRERSSPSWVRTAPASPPLIRSVAGLVPKFAGRVILAGTDITALPAHQVIRHGLAFVPQTENVFAGMTVADNFALAAAILPARDRTPRIGEMYAFFPRLEERRGILAGRLSGGERQMLAVARALMVRPKLLVLDEASAGLSPKMVETVFVQLKAIRETGVTILLVEQNVRAALGLSDRAYILAEGQNRHAGKAADLWNDPVVADLYLGGARTPEAVA